MKKNCIKALIVLITFISVYLICNKILMLKSEDGIEQMKSFYLQDENSVDVLLVGSSHIYCNVNTGTLWDEYGMAAFDLGGAEQPLWNSYYFIKEALKTQKPKVVVLSITIPGIRYDDYQIEPWLVSNIYGMKWSKDKLDNIKVSTLSNSFWRLLNPMNTFHERYDELKRDDFIDSNYVKSYKGFDLRTTTVPFDTPDISGVTEEWFMGEKEEEYLRKIIELTKEKDVPLLLVSVPFVVTEDAQKVYNYEFSVAREEGVDYIDFNKCYDDFGMNFQTDMAEDLHLNISGSRKFTTYLGKILKEKYDVPSHKDDPKYASWEREAVIQKQEIAAYNLSQVKTLDKYIKEINNDNYIVYISNSNVENLADVYEISKQGGYDVFSAGAMTNSNALIFNNGNLLFSTAGQDFETFIDQGIDKLMFKREYSEDFGCTTKLLANEDTYNFSSSKTTIIVYDMVLKRIVSSIDYSNENNVNHIIDGR